MWLKCHLGKVKLQTNAEAVSSSSVRDLWGDREGLLLIL